MKPEQLSKTPASQTCIAPATTPDPDTVARWTDAERRLLGSLLLWPDEPVLDDALAAGVSAASFYVPAHRSVFRAIESLRAKGEVADTAAVSAELGPRLKLLGGYGELGRLEEAAPATTLHTRRDAAAIAEAAAIRAVGNRIQQAKEALANPGVTAADIAAILGPTADDALLNDSKAWTVRDAASMAADVVAAPPELVRGVNYRGGTMMLSGASKSMKSFTMIALGLAVATGREWLGFKCDAAPVLFLNLELQQFSMERRVREVAAAMRIDPPANFIVVHLRGKLVSVDTLERMLRPLLKRHRPGLVVVDPHYKVSSASKVEENSNDAQGLLLSRLENLVCPTGAALVLAHHFSKGDKSQTKAIDRSAGGGVLARWPDVAMTLTEHTEAACATVEMSLRDFAPVEPFVVRWKYPVWTRDGTLDAARLKKAGRPSEHDAAEVLEKLTAGMTRKEWQAATKLPESTFRRKRTELEDTNRVRCLSGCYFHVEPPKSP